jgi:glycosyltransferase involved in cell wall biosynthesis
MSVPLLSITIPTFNRAVFLDRCLNSICSQLAGLTHTIELLVSDNASADRTGDIIAKYKNAGNDIKYIRNSENKGVDFNVAQCYTEAKGRYVMVVGDDDFFVTGGLKVITEVLAKHELGVLYLKNYALAGDEYIDKSVEKIDVPVTIMNNRYAFLKRITYFTTFASGNIINKKALQGINLEEGFGTNLVQLPFILNAINSFRDNAIVEVSLIAMQTENSGGYRLFKTFGPNFMKILSEVYAAPGDQKYKDVIARDLLLTFFPYWIHRFKSGNDFQKEGDIYAIMHPLFKGYLNFWIFNYPMIKMNHSLATFYLKGLGVLIPKKNR